MKWSRFMGVLISEKTRAIDSNRFGRKKKRTSRALDKTPDGIPSTISYQSGLYSRLGR